MTREHKLHYAMNSSDRRTQQLSVMAIPVHGVAYFNMLINTYGGHEHRKVVKNHECEK